MSKDVIDSSLLREKVNELAKLIDSTVPDGGDKQNALTRLQEAAMWASQGIAVENFKRANDKDAA